MHNHSLLCTKKCRKLVYPRLKSDCSVSQCLKTEMSLPTIGCATSYSFMRAHRTCKREMCFGQHQHAFVAAGSPLVPRNNHAEGAK